MRSIRLSLALYFLGLLAVALGAASLLVYRTSQETLQAKRETTEELIQAQYRARCHEQEARLDEALYFQAQTLARLAQFQVSPELLLLHHLHVFGAVAPPASPAGAFASAAVWVNMSVWGGPLHQAVVKPELARIRFDESQLFREGDERVAEYFQINTTWGSSYQSHSLGGRAFPIDLEHFGAGQVLHREQDVFELAPGLPVRRVVLKIPATQLPTWPIFRKRPPGPHGGPEPRSPGEAHDPRPAPEPPPPPAPPRPAIFIQCACDLTHLERDLGVLRTERDVALAGLEQETHDSLARLRNRLLLISGVVFGLAAFGCLWLVRLGLAPLARLSEAVSRVTPRECRLHVDEARLPVELLPIAERLRATLDLLQRSFAREKQATADISHELRTPLAALLTTTEIALRKPRAAEQYRELLSDCRASALQMNHAVERLLTLARLDAGVERLKLQDLDAGRLAEQCAALVRPLAEARGLRLAVRADGPALVHADPDKLREVVTNLLHNAIQYNRPGGSVDVAVARRNGHLEVAVADTGIGIAPAAREQIFQRFFRVDPSRGADGLHAGLGLAIVKEYVELMGGTIAVDSEEGLGSTFRVRLPITTRMKDEG